MLVSPLVAARFGQNHFSQTLGVQILHAEGGNCLIKLPVQPGHRQNLGFVHGGILATLADIAMGFAASSLQDEHHHVLTGELKISYLNPTLGEEIFAEGTTLKAGRKIVFTEAEVFTLAGDVRKLVAKASSSMVVVSRAEVSPQPTEKAR